MVSVVRLLWLSGLIEIWSVLVGWLKCFARMYWILSVEFCCFDGEVYKGTAIGVGAIVYGELMRVVIMRR